MKDLHFEHIADETFTLTTATYNSAVQRAGTLARAKHADKGKVRATTLSVTEHAAGEYTVRVAVERPRPIVLELRDAAQEMLRTLEQMTTEEFARGGEREARDRLARAVALTAPIDTRETADV